MKNLITGLVLAGMTFVGVSTVEASHGRRPVRAAVGHVFRGQPARKVLRGVAKVRPVRGLFGCRR